MFRICLFALLLTVSALSSESSGPIIKTSLGKVLGWERQSRDGRLYQAWTGIPYAQPPMGRLRFKAPKPAKKWTGILNATGESPLCLQQGPYGGSLPRSEDCLFLSVYRPKNDAKKLPVLVHVHGGGFQVGFMGPKESADFIMDEDVVLVTIHYRLNGFGFMSLGNKLMPGNFGIKDQVLALKWVQKNIAAFGGNPKSVTVFGESAGAASTHFLLKTPATEGLVHRALSDSGSLNRMWSLLDSDVVRNATLVTAEKAGCRIDMCDKKLFDCLQKVDAATLLKMMGATSTSYQKFVPCIEPEGSKDAVATYDITKRPVNKPWIASNSNGEYSLFKNLPTPQQTAEYQQDIEGYLEKFIRYFLKYRNIDAPPPSKIEEGVQLLKQNYFPVVEPVDNFTTKLAEVTTDLYFPYCALQNLLNHQGPKWYYFFEYVGELSGHDMSKPNNDVAAHAEQMYYYFNFRSMLPKDFPKGTPKDYEVSKRMIKYLVNFAYHDDPTPPGSPLKWHQFNGHDFLSISNKGSDTMADGFLIGKLRNILNLWNKIIGW